MDAVVITLNGTPVSGRPGMTILELAREVGVKIPTLCHDPSLKPVGACRICLVEDEKSGRLLASCVTPIAPGMVIQTASPAVIDTRKVIVELMLASHPESCLLCEKGNRCQLRGLAAELGIGALRYYPMPHFSETREANPFVLRDLSKCILCGKCIRADHELVVTGALEYLHRGFDAKPATTFDGPLESSECTFCGTCVSMCPTGALFEKGKPHIGTVSNRTPSVCAYCGCGCNILLQTHEDHLVSTVANPMNDLNGRTLCARGRYGGDYVHHSDRLKTPLIRKNGELQQADWDEALDFVASGLMRCHAAHGPEALAFFGSARCTNEENYIFQKIARSLFGTNNIDNGARLHSGASLEALPLGSMTGPIRDIEAADVILVAGSNPSASHPVASYAIKRAVRLNGAKLIVIDPRRTELASFASAWAQIRMGADAVVIRGILKGLLHARTGDKASAEANRADIAALLDLVGQIDESRLEAETGCSPALLRRITALLADAKSFAIVYGHGITRQTGAPGIIRALATIARLGGAGIYPLDKENNGQGAWDMGCMPDRFPGFHPVADSVAKGRFETAWGRHLPGKPGIGAFDMVLGAEAGKIRAMYVMGENPVRAFPDSPRVSRALSGLEFLVVQDLFPTATAKLAHAVLPSCSFAEKTGTFTNIEGRVQRIRRALAPLHQSRSDLEILCMLSCRLHAPATYRSAEDVMAEIASLVPLYSAVTPGRLESGGVFRAVPESGDKEFPLLFEPASNCAAALAPGEFTLLRGSSLFYFHDGTRSTRSARLGAMHRTACVEISPHDARTLGLEDGDTVRVRNSLSDVLVTVSTSRALPAGMLFTPCFDNDISALFPLGSADSGLNACTVRLEREDRAR